MMSRKILSMILVLALVFSLSVAGFSALADEPEKEPRDTETTDAGEEAETPAEGEEAETPPEDSALFPDVSEDEAYAEAVAWAVENGIVTGYDDGTFKPGDTVTRGQAVVFLHRLAGEPDPALANSRAFSDMDSDAYYANAVLWALSIGLINGYPDGTFKPNATVSRQDLAVLILRYAEKVTPDKSIIVTQQYILFTDEDDISDYAANALQTLYKLGVITGVANETTLIINPRDGATRAQTVSALYSFAEVLENAVSAESFPAVEDEPSAVG
jgi:hypothetical protein